MLLGLIYPEGHTQLLKSFSVVFHFSKGLDFEWINMLGINGTPAVIDRMSCRECKKLH